MTASVHASNDELLESLNKEQSAPLSAMLQSTYSVAHYSNRSIAVELAPPAGCTRVVVVVVVSNGATGDTKARKRNRNHRHDTSRYYTTEGTATDNPANETQTNVRHDRDEIHSDPVVLQE